MLFPEAAANHELTQDVFGVERYFSIVVWGDYDTSIKSSKGAGCTHCTLDGFCDFNLGLRWGGLAYLVFKHDFTWQHAGGGLALGGVK